MSITSQLLAGAVVAGASIFGFNTVSAGVDRGCCCGENCTCEECGCADGTCVDCNCEACGCENCNCGDSCDRD